MTGSDTKGEGDHQDQKSGPPSPGATEVLPTVASTTKRAIAAWWFLFLGPVIIVVALLVAGIASHGSIAWIAWIFTMGVWAFSLTLGVAVTPRSGNALSWIPAFLLSFLSAGVALGLVFATSNLTGHIKNPSGSTSNATPTPAASSGPSGLGGHPDDRSEAPSAP